MFDFAYKRNLKRFMIVVDAIVQRANKQYSTPDCTPYLIPKVEQIIERSKSQIARWNENTNVERFAHTVLYNVAFDTLSSGALHLYRGVLDPMSPANKLQWVVSHCLEYAVKTGEITREQYNDQLLILNENIERIG